MRFPSSAILGLLLAWTGGAASRATVQKESISYVKEILSAPPRGWVKHGYPHPNHTITLRIGLSQPNFHVLEQHLMEISDPDHLRYGDYLSKEEVETLVAPHDETLALVNKWLAGFKDITTSPAKDWIILTVPVGAAETLLNTTYFVWRHVESGHRMVRTLQYSVPVELVNHIDLIQPTTMFTRWKSMASTIKSSKKAPELVSDTQGAAPYHNPSTGVTVNASCANSITIDCLKQLYNVDYTPKIPTKNSIGVASFLDFYANFQDLQLFYAEQVPQAVGSSFDVVSIAGTFKINVIRLKLTNDRGGILLILLITRFAFGLSYPTPATMYTTGGSPPFLPDVGTPSNDNEPYQAWLDYVLSHPNPPHVISTSYGDHEQTVPESYAIRACKGFAQLGARGVSLTTDFMQSGDGGVGDGDPFPGDPTCVTNDGQNIPRFLPIFPSTCPYVTSVGGTQGIMPETAASLSGGGFSNLFPRPWYQDSVVKTYLNNLPKGLYAGLYNTSGRGFPDVAAQALNFRIFLGGSPGFIAGTSASTPTFAGLIALVNDARIAKGQPTLGFLNPLLYQPDVTETFNDIISGHNPGCGTEGFNATTGWDPVTGLGTANLKKLMQVLGLN
ncbi:tripeptidyl peptidase A [Mycena floridula]|nr:tripeptidyl peptidase A [Mycena floridula]